MATSTAVFLLFLASQVLLSISLGPSPRVVEDRGVRMNTLIFSGYINGSRKSVSGQTMFMQGSEVIVDLKITEHWYFGTGDVSVDNGGIGTYSATWSYDVPQGAELAFTVEIVSNKYWWDDDWERESVVPKITRTFSNTPMKEVRRGEVEFSRITTRGAYEADWQMSRAVRFIHSIDDKFVSCYGESSWFGGAGKTTLTGGIGRNSLDLNHNIPINVTALYIYECNINRDFPSKTEPKVQQPVSAEFEEFFLEKFHKKEEIIDQIYGTYYDAGEDVWNFRSKKISNITGDGWWSYGKGDFRKQAGGKGHTFVVFGRKNLTEGAYGYFKYDLTIQP